MPRPKLYLKSMESGYSQVVTDSKQKNLQHIWVEHDGKDVDISYRMITTVPGRRGGMDVPVATKDITMSYDLGDMKRFFDSMLSDDVSPYLKKGMDIFHDLETHPRTGGCRVEHKRSFSHTYADGREHEDENRTNKPKAYSIPAKDKDGFPIDNLEENIADVEDTLNIMKQVPDSLIDQDHRQVLYDCFFDVALSYLEVRVARNKPDNVLHLSEKEDSIDCEVDLVANF